MAGDEGATVTWKGREKLLTLFGAWHKFEVNSRAKVQSLNTRNINKPVEQKSYTQKPDRQIAMGQRFSLNKSSAVREKPNTPRSCLRWIPTGRIFKTVGLRWIPTGNMFTDCTTKVDIQASDLNVNKMMSADNTSGPAPQRKERFSATVTAPRAVDPTSSPSSTTMDQDVPSASTSPTTQEIKSQVTHQGAEEKIHRHQNA
nr:hypothetical protein [Tanacetum cinerariifolium]